MGARVEATWNGDAARRALARGVRAGLGDAARRVEDASNALAPTLTGQLKGSSSVDVTRDRAAIAYDDEAAVYQHERLDYRHDDGQAKFLEQALNGGAAEAFRDLAASIRAALQ